MSEIDKLAAVTKKVDTVKLVMQENVDLALQNCVKLETIERAAGRIIRIIRHDFVSFYTQEVVDKNITCIAV